MIEWNGMNIIKGVVDRKVNLREKGIEKKEDMEKG